MNTEKIKKKQLDYIRELVMKKHLNPESPFETAFAYQIKSIRRLTITKNQASQLIDALKNATDLFSLAETLLDSKQLGILGARRGNFVKSFFALVDAFTGEITDAIETDFVEQAKQVAYA